MTVAAARPPLRPRRAARRRHAAHEARLHLPPEQPDRDDEHDATSSTRYFERVPEHVLDGRRPGVLRVHRPSPTTRTRSSEYLKRGPAASSSCARSRRSTGSPACASATPSGRASVCAAMAKVRRPFDITTPAQVAALASIGDDAELARRRAVNAEGLARLEAVAARARPRAGPGAVGNFLYVETGERRARALRAAAARGRDRASARRLRRRRPRSASPSARPTSSTSSRPRSARVLRAGADRRSCTPRAQRAALRDAAATRRFRLLFLATLGSGIGTWLALDRAPDRRLRPHALGVVGGALLIANILPAVVRRPAARAARRPALAEEADDRLRRRPARRLRRAAVRRQRGRRSSRSRRSPGSATRSSGRPCSRACRTSSPTRSCATRERAPPARRVAADRDRADRSAARSSPRPGPTSPTG